MTKKILTTTALLALTALVGCQRQQVGNQVGNPIAFSRLTGDYWQIWTMQPDGSKATRITKSLSDKRYPVWSQDGQELFYRTNNNHTFSVNLATGDEAPLMGSFGLSGGAIPSPDGSKFLLVRYRTQLQDSGNLWLAEADGKNSRILTTDTGLQYDPAWSPDGKKIVYICGHGYRTQEIYIIDSDGKNKRKLTNNEAIELLPSFSPDGKTIAYASDMTGDYEIWLMDTDGGNPKQITNSKGIDTRPCWSPDGNNLMFVSNRSGELQLWVMDKDGSNAKQLTDGSPSMDPAWRRNKP
jgi:TolB protein